MRHLFPASTLAFVVVLSAAALSTRAQTHRVSVSSSGVEGNGECGQYPRISADGRFVAFQSEASNLVPGDTNGVRDIFVHDRTTGETTRVSVRSDGAEANGYCGFPEISADGRVVAFMSYATNLVSPAAYNAVYVHDRQTGETSTASRSSCSSA